MGRSGEEGRGGGWESKVSIHTKVRLEGTRGLQDCVEREKEGRLGRQQAQEGYLSSYPVAFMTCTSIPKLTLLPHGLHVLFPGLGTEPAGLVEELTLGLACLSNPLPTELSDKCTGRE